MVWQRNKIIKIIWEKLYRISNKVFDVSAMSCKHEFHSTLEMYVYVYEVQIVSIKKSAWSHNCYLGVTQKCLVDGQ